MTEKPNYYGILPANVRYDEKLKPMAKIIYTEITALSNKWGYCTANNYYFANLYKVSPETVSRWMSQLNKRGFVRIEINPAKGNERKIYPNDQNVNTYRRKDQEGVDKKINTPIDKKIKYNTTSINTTSINREDTPTKPQQTKFKKPTIEELFSYMLEKTKDENLARRESEKFMNHYESNGWKVGRNKMKSWPHAAGGWLGRRDNYKPNRNGKANNKNTERYYGAQSEENVKRTLAILHGEDRA